MIASVRGTVQVAPGTLLIVEVGGVGLAVQVTPQTALAHRVGTEAFLHTALVVREDDWSLYGFVQPDELAVFDLLRSVTGVGPKSALGVLATMTPDQIASAVAAEDDAAFRKVSGIGPKTAKLIIVSLAGKLVAFAAAPSGAPRARGGVADDVTAALIGLGWQERLASNAVADALAIAPAAEQTSVPLILRRALALLGPRPGGTA